MHKIIITEEQLRFIKESIDIQNVKLPDFIVNSIKQHKTSLGKHNAFPPEKEITFEEGILKKRYFELLTNVKKVDGVNGDISKKTLVDRLEKLVVKCKEIEEPIKDKLEEICFEFVNDIFGIKYGDINIKCVLTDNIKIRQQVTPKALEDSFFEDTEHIESLTGEIMKRRLIDSLVQGACVRLSSNYETILNKIYTLDQRLPEMYYNINAINEYLSFITEKKPNNENIGGIVSVDLSSDEPIIESEGIIFTTLLYETIKGVMELLSSHGLPDDKTSAEYIIGQADFLLAENWDKRFGVGMWDILMDTIKHENMNILPAVFVELVSIPTDRFDKVMREVFAKTKKGKRIIENLVSEILMDDKFSEIDKSLSVDNDNDYFTPEELISNLDGVTETDTSSAGSYAYDAPAFLDAETADHSNLISRSVKDGINEEKEYYDFYDEQIDSVSNILNQFISDKKRGISTKKWRLIPAEQYKNALIEFMRYGEFLRFPIKYIDQWANIVTNNTLELNAITELNGHSNSFPYEEFCSFFGFDENGEHPELEEKYLYNYNNCNKYLSEIGFYDWCTLPDGSDAISDYGLRPLYKLIMELEEQDTPEQKIVVINKILDVYHQRGDLASAFIQGGSKTLSQISYDEREN